MSKTKNPISKQKEKQQEEYYKEQLNKKDNKEPSHVIRPVFSGVGCLVREKGRIIFTK